MPSFAALWFIILTNFASVPPTASASAVAHSFADGNSMPASRSCTLTSCPSLKLFLNTDVESSEFASSMTACDRTTFVSKAILPASIASCTSRYVISFEVDAICVTASSLHAYRISPVSALPSRLPCRKLKYPFSSKCLMSITNGVLVSTVSSVCDFNSVVMPNTRPKSTSFIYKPPSFS